MLLKNIDIYVYDLDDTVFDGIGQVNEYTSLMWPDKYNGYTTFELNAPVTQENSTLLKEGNIIWCGGNNAAMIEIVKSDSDENGQKVFNVKGRTLEMLLTTRIIWGTYTCVNKYSSTAMYEIVKSQCIETSDPARIIPFLECAEDEELGKKIAFQKTGGEVYDALETIATDADLGFDILFRPKEKKLIFKVIEGVDRSYFLGPEDASKYVVFSTDLEDILESSYYTNYQDVKTLAFVNGEGEGSERKHIISGNNASRGFRRREMYIDARDIQSKITHEDGTETTIPADDYNDLLNDRGTEKLAECIAVKSFEVKMRVTGDVQYKYGIDYNKGDKVRIQDTDLKVYVAGRVTEVSENFDDEYELIITFGYDYPTFMKRVKREISK